MLTRGGFLVVSAMTLGAASAAGVAASWDATSARAADAPGRTRPGGGGQNGAGFVEAVLAAFRNHRLVAVGEGGAHGLQEHHDALAMLLADPRLPEVVNDVVVEFGNARYQATMDRFTAGEPVGNTDLRPVWRDTTQSPLGTWEEPVFEHVYRTVRAVNGTLAPDKRMRVLLGDPPIDWSKIEKRKDLEAFLVQRDAHAASVVEREVLRKGRRALICYGVGHVIRTSKQPALPPGLVSVIENQTGERVYTVASLVPLSGDPEGLARRLTGYPRRTVIPTSGTWLGDFNAGLLFPAVIRGSGSQPTNAMCGVALESVLDAGLYVGQPDSLTLSRENPAVYLDPGYWEELRRRNTLQGGIIDLDSYRQERSVRFTPQEVPPSLLC
ncbi:hypothetical protein [Pseudofrankia inefficax]|nr:hypothetical protein [Pseudofrankia inefficax]